MLNQPNVSTSSILQQCEAQIPAASIPTSILPPVITPAENLYDPERINFCDNEKPPTDTSSQDATCSKNEIATTSHHPPIVPTPPSTQDILKALRPRTSSQKSSIYQKDR